MCSLLGGRAAEEVCFSTISTGALNDLERATKMAYSMVVYYGMSDKLSNISYFDSSRAEYSFTKPYSEKTAELIDKEVKAIIDEQYNRAKDLINSHREQHKELADLLVEKEVIFADDVERIFGKRPWTSRQEELSKESKKDSEDNTEETTETEETKTQNNNNE